ncbi:MAG: aldehyde dehydrogenase family protein [Clostridiales Family XIII bacterium]|nr:aldehyde dehydrogenase family protein [Clostridiales Family XIII bacterium]
MMRKKLDVMNPQTNELIESLALATGEELEQMVEAAYKAQPAWEAKPLYERASILYKFMDAVEQKQNEIGEILAREMAKPIGQAAGECVYAPEIGRGYIERAKHLYGEVLSQSSPGFEDDLIFTKREALGVVAGIIPFNYPVEMVIQKSVPSMIMGNTVILKAPSSNPLAVKKMVETAHEAGVPDDVLQFTVCDRKTCTEYLLTNDKIAAISLTGSTEAGIEMVKAGADTMKRVFLELGGNDPLIIRSDADLDTAVQSTIDGRWENNGQICCADKRFLVHKDIKDLYVEKLKAALDHQKRGSAMDPDAELTCLVTEEAAIKVEKQIGRTVEQGGKVVYGGRRKGAFIEPTIIDGVPKDADVAFDMEIFGPVYPIFPFETDEEAIELANQTRYGLMAGIVTSDIVKAFELAAKLKASGVCVNGSSCYRQNEQAFGGCKASGIGNEGVSASLEEYSRIKTYALKGAFPANKA